MTPQEQELFISSATGLCFRLGFESLLLACAKSKGAEASSWLAAFEAKVIGDVQRMSAQGDIPAEVARAAVGVIASEFSDAFGSVRAMIRGNPAGSA